MGSMPRLRTANGLFLIVLLSALGFLLVYVPTKVVELYDRVKGLGPPFIYFYWGMVGTGAAILALLAINIAVQFWRVSRAKTARRLRGAKNPSQLSLADQQREVA